jgi:hypothetical protein
MSLECVVKIYVRVNSAGKRVEPEERSFAALIPIVPRLEAALNEVATVVHGPASVSSAKELRDVRLKRQRETQFGLPLISLIEARQPVQGRSDGTRNLWLRSYARASKEAACNGR